MEPIIEDSIIEPFTEDFIYYWDELNLSGKEILKRFHERGLPELKLYQIYYFAKRFKLQKKYKDKKR